MAEKNIKDIEKLKSAVIKRWYVLNSKNKSYFQGERQTPYIWTNNNEILELYNILLAWEKIDPSVKNKKLEDLICLLKMWLEGNVKDIHKWYKGSFICFSHFIADHGVYVQKDSVIVWVEEKLSNSFPRTWKYLQEYVPLRYPQYFGKNIPDPKVKIMTVSLLYRLSSGKGVLAVFKGGNIMKGLIAIDLALVYPKTTPKDIDEVIKCVNYIDSYPKYSTMIVHEYEHYLQARRFGMFRIKKCSDSLPDNIGIRQTFFHNLLDKFEGLNKICSKIIMLEKKIKKNPLGEYEFNPLELESRLAEFIFLKVSGYREEDVLKLQGYLTELPERIKAKLDGIKGLKQKYENDLKLFAPPKIKAQCSKKVRVCGAYIKIYNQFLNDYPYLLKEADRVANMIRSKREQLEKKLE